MAAFITPVEVTPGSSSAWTDVDVSSLGVPSGATGVILHYENISGSTAYAVGWRNNGSTDARIQTLALSAHAWVAVGVDASRIFEAYVGHTTNTNIYLVGYFTTDAVFFTNGVDKSIGTTTTWTDVDISGDTGGDTAIGAIVEVISAGTLRAHGLRKNGSTDNRITTTQNHHAGVWIIGVDGSEIFEAYIANVEQDHFLLGYIKSDWTFLTNATDLSTGTTGSYVDLTALPAGALGGLIEVSNSATAEAYALRKNGSSEDIYRNARNHPFAIVEADGSQLVEGKIASTTMDFWLVGYPTAVSGAADLVIQNASHAHTAANLTLTQVHALTVANAAHGHTAQNLTLTQVHALAVNNAAHSHTAANLALTQVHQLAIHNSAHAHTAANLALTQVHSLAVQNASHGHSAENLTLTQAHVLAVQNASHAHAADNVTLNISTSLSIANATHGHTAEQLTLTQVHTLTVNNSSHSHTADSFGLTQVHALAIQNASHTQTAENVGLTQVHSLVVQNATHSHIAPNLTLSEFNPSNITGLNLWLQGDDAATGDITTWSDASGQGNNGTGVSTPQGVDSVLNGHKVVRFEADNLEHFTFPNFVSSFTAGEIFIVVKLNADPPAGNDSGLWHLSSEASVASHFPWSDGNIYDGFGSTARKTVGNPALSLASWRIYSVRSAPNDWEAYLDGASIFATTSNTVGFPTNPLFGRSVGAVNYHLDGDVAEIVLYDRALTTNERGNVWQYLAQKYALTLTVDLTIQSATHSHTANNLALTQNHVLAVQNATHGHTASSPALVVDLAIGNAAHGHVADNLTLTQVHSLSVQSGTHAHTAPNIALTQVHGLAIAGATHGHTAPNLTITETVNLNVQSAVHSHSAQGLGITQAHNLTVSGSIHSHLAQNILLGTSGVLLIADAFHAHKVQNISFAWTQPADLYTVAAEDRFTTVPSEDRFFVVPEEDRTFEI